MIEISYLYRLGDELDFYEKLYATFVETDYYNYRIGDIEQNLKEIERDVI